MRNLFALAALCAVAPLLTIQAQSGIGTVTPDADKALHVKARDVSQDPLRLEGLKLGSTEEDVIVTDANGRLRYRPITDLTVAGEWRDEAASNYIYAYRALTEGTPADVVITDAGAIGIGITTPLAKLDVVGDVLVRRNGGNSAIGASAGMLRVVDQVSPIIWGTRGVQVADRDDYAFLGLRDAGAGRNNSVIAWGSSPEEDFRFTHRDGSTETDVLHLDGQSKNLGIGVINPSARLHVQGDARITTLAVGDVDNLGVDDEVVTADAQGTLRKVPAATLFSAYQDDDWTINGNDIYSAKPGNVGVGTNTPDTKLNVDGTVRIDNGGALQLRDGNSSLNSSNGGDLDFHVSDRTYFRDWDTDAEFAMVIDQKNSEVGIRTENPAYPLDINGAARIQGTNRLYFGNSTFNQFYAFTNNDLRVRANERFSVRNRDDNADVLTVVTNTGVTGQRVGIRTQTPAATLDVAGDVRVGTLAPNSTSDQFVTVNTATGLLETRSQSDIASPWDRNETTRQLYPRDLLDKVGIGTTAPRAALHVYEPVGTVGDANDGSLILQHGNAGGSSSITFMSRANENSDFGYIRYSDDGSANGTTAENSLLEFGTENDGPGNWQDDIALMPSGRVGVGTRAPQSLLHVAGDVRVDNLPTWPNDQFAVTTDGSGQLHRAPISSIKDNLGNHIAEQNINSGGYFFSPDGTDQGLRVGENGTVIGTNRFQMGNNTGDWYNDPIGGQTDGFFGNDIALWAPVRDNGTEDSDLRLYILDNSNDAFSIWGNPCGGGNCGSIDASQRVAQFQADGRITFDNLSGAGDRMVVALADGTLDTQPIPTAGGGSTADNLGDHVATQNIRLNDRWLTNDGTNSDGLRVSNDGTVFFNTSRVLAWSNNNLWDVYSTTITGDTDADGNGGNNDLRIVGRDDIVMEARGDDGDITLDANEDVVVRADEGIDLIVDGTGATDDIRFYTRNNQQRMQIRNNGDVRVNDLAGAGTRIVTAAPDGTLQVLTGSSTGLWDRDAANGETILTNATDQVGIGWPNPDADLHISQERDVANGPVEIRIQNRHASGGQTALFFEETFNDQAGIRLLYDGVGDAFRIQEGSGEEYFTIERNRAGDPYDDGFVGIGTSDPNARLHIAQPGGTGDVNRTRFVVQNTTTQGSSEIQFIEGANDAEVNGNSMKLRYNSAAGGAADGFEILRGNTNVPHFRIERDGGQVTVTDLATGGADEMVVANGAGVLSTRVIDAVLWSRDGANSETYLANTGDKVGIGSVDPTAILDVNGDVRVRALPIGTASDAFVVAGTNGMLRQVPASTFQNYWARDAADGEVYLGATNDKVGIGTSSPLTTFDVEGTVRVGDLQPGTASDALVVADAAGQLRQISSDVLERFWNRNAADGSVALATGTDLVGIGTATPQAKLHVDGTVRFNALANVADGELVMADAEGNLYTRALPDELWQRSGTTTFLAYAGDRVGVGTAAPAATLDVQGNLRITTAGGTTADDILVQDASGEVRAVPSSTYASHWVREAASNEVYPGSLTDRVGVGTADPLAPLHVVGQTRLDGAVAIAGDAGVTGRTTTAALAMPTGAAAGYVLQSDAGGNATWVATNTFTTVDTDDQTLALAGNTLSLERGGAGINLAPYLDNTDAQQLTLAGDALTLVNGGTPVDLSPYLDNTDAQGLSLSGTTIEISGGADVDIASILPTDTDDQQLTLAANTLSLERGGLGINLAPYLDNTDTQQLTLVGDALTLVNGGAPIDLSPYLGPWTKTGAAVTLATAGDEVGIGAAPAAGYKLTVAGDTRLGGDADLTGALGAAAVNTAAFTLPTGAAAGYVLQSDAAGNAVWVATGTFTTVDTDTDDQQLTLATNTLTLERGGAGINLVPYLDNTDAQDLSLSGTTIEISGGAGVDIASILPSNTDSQTLAYNNVTGVLTINGGNSVGLGSASGDNLGNHTATQTLNLAGQWLNGDADAAEGLTVDATGRVGIGVAAPTAALDIAGNVRVGLTDRILFGGTDAYATRVNAGDLALVATGANAALQVDADFVRLNGSVTIAAAAGAIPLIVKNMPVAPDDGTSYFNLMVDATGTVFQSRNNNSGGSSQLLPSDRRLKQDIQPMHDVLGLLDHVQAYQYRYRPASETGVSTDAGVHYGVIAQELLAAFPHAVDTTGEYLSIRTRELDGILLAASKELAARNAHLEALVHHLQLEKADLEREVDGLSARTEQLEASVTAIHTVLATQTSATSAAQGAGGE